MLGGLEWEITSVHSVTDGDTLRLYRRRTEILDDYVAHDVYDRIDVSPRGVAIRVINLDTPETKDKVGWARAKLDVVNWMLAHQLDGLKIMTWADGGFSRFLGNIYYEKDGVRHSLTEYMLTEGNDGKGWDPYVP